MLPNKTITIEKIILLEEENYEHFHLNYQKTLRVSLDD